MHLPAADLSPAQLRMVARLLQHFAQVVEDNDVPAPVVAYVHDIAHTVGCTYSEAMQANRDTFRGHRIEWNSEPPADDPDDDEPPRPSM
jgi:hypothetical protein